VENRGGNNMPGGKKTNNERRFFSFTASIVLVMSTLLIGISLDVPNGSAGATSLNAGELQIGIITDFGRIFLPLQWPNGGTFHTVSNSGGISYMGLVVDQQNYDHTPGSMDIADCYTIADAQYMNVDDFVTIKTSELIIDTPEMDKMIASFQNTGTTQDANDILINQTAWSVKDKDWVILQWHVNNIKSPSADILDFKIGFEVDISQVGGSYGLGGDSGDDIDGFDAAEDVYWAQDDGGTGVCLGFASSIVSDPINHYYSEDYHPATYDDYKAMWEDEDWLYGRISAANQVAGATPGNRTSTAGWNGFTIPAGGTRTFTMVVAMNNTYSTMITAIKDAQWYYKNVLTGFLLTEFSDSVGNQQIEVYNNGREPTSVSSLSFSLDGGSTFLTGVWNPNPIPTYEYSVFTLTGGGTIGIEGDTVELYEYGDLIDQIAFGLEGKAPDPLSAETSSRYWDDSKGGYTDDWTRDVTTSFGGQNNVPPINSSSFVIINEVMFNPHLGPEGKYFVLINRQPGYIINISGFIMVSDAEYVFPDFPMVPGGFNGTLYPPGESQNSVIIKYMDDPPNSDPFFQTMNDNAPIGDNVYFYDPNGRLLDMVGWDTQHTQGMSVRRVPDGNGTHKGYNDTTSIEAGWVFDHPPHVLITELSDDEGTSEIEVYNPSNPLIDFSVGYTFENSMGAPLTGVWIIPYANAGEYGLFDITSGNLDHEGDSIRLFHNGVLIEDISYGTKGTVPDPLAGESVQRYWDGVRYTNVWERNWTTGPHFGSQNNVPPANFSSLILLNEILFNPDTPVDHFVELYLLHGSLNISGYRIVCNSDFIIPIGIELNETNRFFNFTYSMDSPFFNELDRLGDNVYLYDDNGSLLDMAGWSSLHQQGWSMRRIPDGNGTRVGFDDASSIAAGWVFGNETEPTPPPPSPPEGLMTFLINDAEDVMLTWNASSDDGAGDNDIAGYSVYRSSIGLNGNYDFAAWIPANGSLSYSWIDFNAGDGDWNNYFYIVRANDTLDLEEQNTNKAGKFTNYMVKNWNLMSVPLIQANTSLEYVLQTIEGNYTIVQGYHAGKSRPWLHYHKNKPKYFNDEIKINHKEGYYIKMINPDYLIVAGRVPADTHISLITGWNLIGYPCLVNKTRDDALSSISGKYNMVEYYDPVKGKEVRLGPDDFMQPGLGYWIHTTEDCVLIL
jgi:hypothetical protein